MRLSAILTALAIFPTFLLAESTPDFAHEIRPILSNHCFKCHGPDQDERKGGKEGSGGLRLDMEDGARADLGGLMAIVPGKPDESELIARIVSKEADELMPPPKTGKKLTPQEIDLLTRWVKAGGKYTKHWAYAPLEVREPDPAKTIDSFIRARLAVEGLASQPEADRYSLIRRASLDLTGLPPTIEEVDAFVNDTRPEAYERLVDRLLASPAYGEHWARMWLDLARYADSAGYADDPSRTIWAFRDYVIRALNANKPFDQFTIEQIAGDLLPNASEDQIIATAFHRNTMTNSEGGTNDEEFRNAAIVDRVNTTMSVWMGTSFACAQCHTHKYDPITQAEYFRMFAFFNNTEDADRRDESPLLKFFSDEQKAQRAQLETEFSALDAKFKTPSPMLIAQAGEWARAFPAKLEWTALKPAALKAQSGAAMSVAEDGLASAASTAAKDTFTVELPAVPNFSALRIEGAEGNGGGNFVVTRVRATLVPPAATPGPKARFLRIELPGKTKILQIAEVQVFSGGENVAPRGEARQSSTYTDAVAQRAIDGNTAAEYAKGSVSHTAEGDEPWWEVDLKEERELDRVVIWNRAELPERMQGFRLVALDAQRQPVWEKAENGAPMLSAAVELNGGREVKFTEAISDFTQAEFDEDLVLTDAAVPKPKRGKKRGPQKGWAVGGATGKPHTLALLAEQPVAVAPGLRLVVTIEQQSPFEKLTLARFRIATTSEARAAEFLRTPVEVIAEIEKSRTAAPAVEPTAGGVPGRTVTGGAPVLLAHYVREVAPELEADRARMAALRKQVDDMVPGTVPVMRDIAVAQRRKTHVQIRGNYLSLGEEVSEGVPAAFNPLPEGAPMNRLTLAKWLVDAGNPLTPRVTANRFWEAIFGVGLVRTSEEFGAQGELPSHPELLDWLAGELVNPTATPHSTLHTQPPQKWDAKRFLKTLVMSATYRQSSRVTPELAERDPDNRLLARGPRFRLSAEMVRDQALSVSGLLSRKMYGPSVRPVRPALGLAAAFGAGLDWQTSAGEDQHRRALYTEWRRTSPYPSMTTFDAPNREVCTVRRNRSNTPLQALVTMNDPVYIEAAQALARRISKSGATPADQVRDGFRLCLARFPTESEMQRLTALFDEALAFYKQDAAKATEMATVPIGPVPAGADVAGLAAWTTVANVLLNLDETLMKR